MAGKDATRMRHWAQAIEKAAQVPRWLAFRYVFAQAYNAHQPTGKQAHTRRRAAQVAQELVRGMGGSLMAPPPPGLGDDSSWRAFLEAVQRLEPAQGRALMAWLVVREWPHPSRRSACHPQHREDQRTRLILLLLDMEVQQLQNAARTTATKRPGRGAKRARA